MLPWRPDASQVTTTDGTVHMFDGAAVERGLKLMAEREGELFGKLLAGRGDTDTADVVSQLAVVGELR